MNNQIECNPLLDLVIAMAGFLGWGVQDFDSNTVIILGRARHGLISVTNYASHGLT